MMTKQVLNGRMTDIFFSYAREDTARAEQLAGALADNGWTVWWDRSIPPGRSFDEVIETHLMEARCVVVLWSEASLTSNWVKEEAEDGLQRGILTPALIESVRPPLGFRRVHAADLTTWNGDPSHEGYQQLSMAIRALLGDAESSISSDPATSGKEGFENAESVPLVSPESTLSESATIEPDAADTLAGTPVASATSNQIDQIPRSRVPLWISPIAALALIAVVYISLNYELSQNSSVVREHIESLVRQPTIEFWGDTTAESASTDNESFDYFLTALAPEIDAGLVVISFENGYAIIRLDGRLVFRSGHADVSKSFKPTLARIGQVLAEWRLEPIRVLGQTDNRPIAHADAVASELKKQLPQDINIQATEFADSSPLAEDSTSEGAGLNRRIEIQVPLK